MKTLRVNIHQKTLVVLDIRGEFGSRLDQLPWVLRILLENALRNSTNADQAKADFDAWLRSGKSAAEVAFYPQRLLMHDTTCVPALVDIAAMRDELAERGVDPTRLSHRIPTDVSVDHSIAVDRFGQRDALQKNAKTDMMRSGERYRMMKWATNVLPHFRVHPPGTGIMHTINLEQLATVISVIRHENDEWAVPDTLVGTDSHTPMINGIGVLGWGVGGLEAESVLLGLPVMIRLPEVIGVRLIGRLQHGVLATDLALSITQRLRDYGVGNRFVEYFGPGVSTLSAGERAVVANMAPEYGAATAFFPIDSSVISYLGATNRSDEVVERVEEVTKAQGLWFSPDIFPSYTDVVDFDLSSVTVTLAGPRRPQDRVAPNQVQAAFEEAEGKKLRTSDRSSSIPDGAVAIAAITSCTNTSDPALLVAAGLLARKARQRGLRPPYWVKTSLAPGSPAAKMYLQRSGLLDDLAHIGFDIVGFGCTTCIGNSGALQPDMDAAIRRGISATAVLSGNRNFPGRVHPLLRNAFLTSPPLTIAFALAGDVARDISIDPIGNDQFGHNVHLKDIWPSPDEIETVLGSHLRSSDFSKAFASASDSALWNELDAPRSAQFPWDSASTYIRRPPFVSARQEPRLGSYTATPLLVVGDDVTTDHISPAGQIRPDSYAGKYLMESCHVPAAELNVYAARRGNWQTMVRGMFDNLAVRNLLAAELAPGTTVHSPSGAVGPLWEIACRYQAEGVSVVLVAGERYGMGSSRDWAAKGVALLGVRAVLAQSFERIHRSNLIGVGILPIVTGNLGSAMELGLLPGDTIHIESSRVSVQSLIPVEIHRAGKAVLHFSGRAAIETSLESALLEHGGAIPFNLHRLTSGQGGGD